MKSKAVTILFTVVTILGTIVQTACSQKEEGSMPMKGNDVAVVETSMGTIEIELYTTQTPKTVKNFVGLAEQGKYDGLIFHRVIDGFMIQGGDPDGTGRGGESIYGGPFEDEFVKTLTHSAPGMLSMANRGPNTNTSQFFITLAPTPWLDGKHTIFGKVIGGMDIVEAIGKVPVSKVTDAERRQGKSGDKPLTDVVMKKVTIRKANAPVEEKK